MARFSALFSSSSGNSMYIGTGEGGILIDIGVSARSIERALRDRDVEPGSIRAIFITHEHIDHVAGLRVFASRYHPKVYATEGTLRRLGEMGHLTGAFETEVLSETPTAAAGMEVRHFSTPHDCAQSCGYRITLPDGRQVAVATDMGRITDEVRAGICGCDLVVIESNHDERMLQNGPYPYSLKRRILSDVGHLSNDGCARELFTLAQSGTTRFVLAHLSEHNNFPELARQTSVGALCGAGLTQGRDFLLEVARAKNQNEMMVF